MIPVYTETLMVTNDEPIRLHHAYTGCCKYYQSVIQLHKTDCHMKQVDMSQTFLVISFESHGLFEAVSSKNAYQKAHFN